MGRFRRATASWQVAKAEWVTIGGKRFYARSQLEKRHAEHLEMLLRAGAIAAWEYEPDTFSFPVLRGSPVYSPDFRVTNLDGSVRYDECKGHWQPRDWTKLVNLARYHPSVTVAVVGRKLPAKVQERIEKARQRGLAELASLTPRRAATSSAIESPLVAVRAASSPRKARKRRSDLGVRRGAKGGG